MNKNIERAVLVLLASVAIIGVMFFKEKVMEPVYVMEEVHINSENKKKDGLEFTIREGDIILDKTYRFEVLPAAMDFTQSTFRKKVSNAPAKQSERLLRIKELGENAAVVAILHQESYCEAPDTIVTKENEELRTVNYGEKFFVYAKQQWMDASGAITYSFIITDTLKSQKQNVRNFCTECGAKRIKGDKFCRECGMPVEQ